MTPITLENLIEWTKKDFLKLLIISIVFAIISVVYALSIPNVYSSKSVVMSNLSESSGIGASLGQFSGIASLAGINLPSGGTSPEVLKEMLLSNSFLASFIRQNELELLLMAAIDYTPSTGDYVYNEKLYDFKQKKWTREVGYPLKVSPSDSELVHKFRKLFSASYDRKTKLITLSFKFYSAEFTKILLEDLITFFNDYMRKIDLIDAEENLNDLQKELEKVQLTEIKVSLQQIIEEQLKKSTFAKTRDQYAIRIVEAPQVAMSKSEPRRSLICVVITTFGVIFSALLLWTRRAIKSNV